MKTTRLDKIFLGIFVVHLGLSVIVLKFFGFEIGLIFSISLLTAIISASFSGLENLLIILNANKDGSSISEESEYE